LVVAQKRIDKAAKVNVITAKSADRRKSNLTLSFNKASLASAK
jgi:ribosomal protein S20